MGGRQILWVSVLSAASMTACGRKVGPPSYEKMHAAACAGDADAFFDQTSEDAIVGNVARRRHQPPPFTRLFVEMMLREWRNDIEQKRASGDICAWTFAALDPIGDRDRVTVWSKAGNAKFLWFEKTNAAYTLTDYETPDGSEGTLR